MWTDPRSTSKIACAELRCLKARDEIRPQPVHEVRTVGLILCDPTQEQITIAVVFLSAEQIERCPLRRANFQLRPSTCSMHRLRIRISGVSRGDRYTLAQSANDSDVLTVEKRTG